LAVPGGSGAARAPRLTAFCRRRRQPSHAAASLHHRPQEWTVKGAHRAGALDSDLKLSYSAPRYSLVATLKQASGALGLSASAKEVAPGLTLGLAGTFPEGADAAKLGVDYVADRVTLKTSATLAAAPKVEAAATTALAVAGADVVAGGSVAYDAAKGAVTKWALGASTAGADYAAAALLADTNDLTLLLSHAATFDTSLAVEVRRNLSSGATALAAGAARRLPGGALQKVRVEHSGLVSVLHEQALEGKSRLALSGQFDAKDLAKAPRYGVALDFKY
jgi:hypothetical protein